MDKLLLATTGVTHINIYTINFKGKEPIEATATLRAETPEMAQEALKAALPTVEELEIISCELVDTEALAATHQAPTLVQ